jgi:hypothetical protein
MKKNMIDGKPGNENTIPEEIREDNSGEYVRDD